MKRTVAMAFVVASVAWATGEECRRVREQEEEATIKLWDALEPCVRACLSAPPANGRTVAWAYDPDACAADSHNGIGCYGGSCDQLCWDRAHEHAPGPHAEWIVARSVLVATAQQCSGAAPPTERPGVESRRRREARPGWKRSPPPHRTLIPGLDYHSPVGGTKG